MGKRRQDKPVKIAKIPIQAITDGISFKKISPKIPENKSGPTNKIIERTKGDNLLKEAKNKLSPIAIPKIPLNAIKVI